MKQEVMTDQAIADANRRFDSQYRHFLKYSARIRTSWNASRLLMGGRLSDQQIAHYRKRGYYSPDLKSAREAYQDRKRRFLR